MILIVIIALYVLISGKFRITRSFSVTGKRARWYGATLLVALVPAVMLIRSILPLIFPEAFLIDPVWSRMLNAAFLFAYMFLLALPFRDRSVPPTKAETGKP